MEFRSISEKGLLAHWTYTRDEWKVFQKWTVRRKSIFHYMWHCLTPSNNNAPEVRITAFNISIGSMQKEFGFNQELLRRIKIRDEGEMNILEIICESSRNKEFRMDELRVLIPKGKLREAIALQEKLLTTNR